MLLFGAATEAFNREMMLSIVYECLHLILVLSTPILLAAIISGVVVAMFQAMTQVQEQTLSFVPKIVATFYAVLKYGPWICTEVVDYTLRMLGMIATFGPKK